MRSQCVRLWIFTRVKHRHKWLWPSVSFAVQIPLLSKTLMSTYFTPRSRLIPKSLAIITAFMIAVMSLAVLNVSTADAAPGTCTWTGASSTLWSTAGNWSGCDNAGVPENGDIVSFPASPTTTTSANDLVGLNLNRVIINGSGYDISGNAVQTTPVQQQAILIGGDDNDYGIDTTVNASTTKTIFTQNTNTISGDIVVNVTGGSSDFYVGTTDTLYMNGQISGSVGNDFGLNTYNGGGTVAYNGENSFTVGGTIILYYEANAECGAENCFGDSANDVSVYNGGNITLTFAQTFANDIIIDSGGGTSRFLVDAGDFVRLTGNITINASATFEVVGTSPVWFDSDIAIAEDQTITFNGYAMEVFGIISGDGNLHSDGILFLDGANTYTGLTTASSTGRISAVHSTALGSTDGETIMSPGSILYFESPSGAITSSEDITLDSAPGNAASLLFGNPNDITLNGTITLDGGGQIGQAYGTGHAFTINGKITGTGDLTYYGSTGSTPITLAGTISNDYIGPTFVSGIRVFSEKTGGAISVPGYLKIESPSSQGVFASLQSEQIHDDATVVIDGSDSLFSVSNTRIETVGIIEGDGLLNAAGSTSRIIVGGTEDGTWAGTTSSGGGTIQKSGTGTWELTGTNTDATGGELNFEVSEGVLLVNFSDDEGAHVEFVVNGGILKGTAEIGTITSTEGTIAPGESPGCIVSNGAVNLASLVTLEIEMNGTTQCSEYDNLTATGAVDLDGATLDVDQLSSYVPAVGSVFTIVNGASVTGQFAGLANGGVVTGTDIYFVVNYTANSVTLTAVATPPVTPESPASTTTIVGALPATGAAVSGFVVALMLIGIGIVLMRRRYRIPSR